MKKSKIIDYSCLFEDTFLILASDGVKISYFRIKSSHFSVDVRNNSNLGKQLKNM